MANRRMFSREITESDAFRQMPLTSQALYFHLGLSADDDGVVNNPKTILKCIGAAEDDLKILLAKRFIIAFEDSGIIVIKHWKINNYIQKDRYTPSKHKKELRLLGLDENNAYDYLDTICIQNGYIDKNSIGKGSEVEDSEALEKEKDINRYNKIKANSFAESLFLELVSCEYVGLKDLNRDSYISYFNGLLNDGYEVKDIKIKLAYFIKTICHQEMSDELDYSGKKTYRPVYKNDRGIENQYLYFIEAMNNSFNRNDINDDLDNSYIENNNVASTDDNDEEVDEDDLPF